MIKTGLISLAAAALFAVSPVAVAQTKAPPTKIAVVDVQKVQQESRAMKAIRDSLQTLRAKYNKEIILQERVREALLGGVVIRVGDSRIDGSLRSRLQTIGSRLDSVRLQSEDYYED